MTDVPGAIEAEVAAELVMALRDGGGAVAHMVPKAFRRAGEVDAVAVAAAAEAAAADLGASSGEELTTKARYQETAWTGRFVALIADHPEAVEDVKALLVDIRVALAAHDAPSTSVARQADRADRARTGSTGRGEVGAW